MMDKYKREVIRLVKANPLLWDPRHTDYKNKDQRQEAWQEIDRVLQPPPGFKLSAKRTWDRLTRSMCNALKRIERQTQKGACSNNVKIKEWRFQKDLNFLLPVKRNRLSLLTGYFDYPIQSEAEDSSDGDVQDEEGEGENEEGETLDQMQRDFTWEGSRGTMKDNDEEEGETMGQMRRTVAWEGNRAMKDDEEFEDKMQTERQTFVLSSPSCSKRRKYTATYLGEGDSAKEEDEELQKFLNLYKQRNVEQSPAESIRLHFFRSIMPQVDALSGDDFLEFQIDVIHSLQKKRTLSKNHVIDNDVPAPNQP